MARKGRDNYWFGPILYYPNPDDTPAYTGGEFLQVYMGQHEWVAIRCTDYTEIWDDPGWEGDIKGWGWFAPEDRGYLRTPTQRDRFYERLIKFRDELDALPTANDAYMRWMVLLNMVKDDPTAEAAREVFSLGDAFRIGPNRKNVRGLMWSNWNHALHMSFGKFLEESDTWAARRMKWVNAASIRRRGEIEPPARKGGPPITSDDLLFTEREKLFEYLGPDDPLCPSPDA